MVDLGQETDLWGCHGVVIWEEELEVEDATWDGLVDVYGEGGGRRTFVGRLRWSMNLDVEVAKVIFMWNCADAWDTADCYCDVVAQGTGTPKLS